MTFERAELKIEALSCSRGGRSVLSELSFVCQTGTAVIVRGPNGAGKSTLLRAIAGLLRPSAGQISLVVADQLGEPSVAEQCHYVGHLDGLKPALSVLDNLQFWSAYLGDGGAAVDRALSQLHLKLLSDMPVQYLSAGQRRRAALARLVAVPRPLWLLDEPTVALDRDSRARLGAIVEDHLGRGGIAVIATHDDLPLSDSSLLELDDGVGRS